MKKYLVSPVMLFALCIILFSCQGHGQTPIKWTSTTVLKSFHGGGMAPESFTVEIKGLNGMYIRWIMPKTDTFRFKLTQKEADMLAKQIHTAHFLSLRSVETKTVIYDAPTTSIELKYNTNRTHIVSEGATMEVRGGHNVEFGELYDYIHDFARKKTNQPISD